MNRLKGKTILIGKEDGGNRLAVMVVGTGKPLIIDGSYVPASVSRLKIKEGIAHARIDIDNAGNMKLTNIKPQNITAVNGSEIATKQIKMGDSISLGRDYYQVDLHAVIDKAKNSLDAILNIDHLYHIWNAHQERLQEIKDNQKRIQLMSRIPMFCTLGGGALGFVFTSFVGDEIKPFIQIVSGILSVIGLLLMVYSFNLSKKDTTEKDIKQENEEFMFKYICPNKKCQKYLGQYPLNFFLHQHKWQCPHCKSKYESTINF